MYKLPGTVDALALARFPGGGWCFAASIGGRIAYGPLARAWDGGPQLRDLDVHVRDRVDEVIVAVPDSLDHDDVRCELRRVPSLALARLHIHTVTNADIAVALGLPAPVDGALPGGTMGAEGLRRAVASKLPVLDVAAMEAGALLAVAMILAGAEAHWAWLGRFGHAAVDTVASPMTVLRPDHHSLPGARSASHDLAVEQADGVHERRNSPQSPDRFTLASAPGHTMLTVPDIVTLYQVSRSFVYALKDIIPHTKFGGLRFKKSDIERHLNEIQRRPAGEVIRRRRPGTRVARSRPDDEVAPGLTARELKERVGF